MRIRRERLERAQALMRDQGLIALMIMNRDDYRYFFDDVRVQPRAIVPARGEPIFIAFAAEEQELRDALGDPNVKVFTHVGEQISNVTKTFRSLAGDLGQQLMPEDGSKPRVGMQMWFDTPAFLVDMFRKVNPQVELVPSDPVMDELRMVKDDEEVELMRQAQRIAALGMDRARSMLYPGITGHEVATEALYTMMRAGAGGTSTPIHVNVGTESCWIHGKVSERAVVEGDTVVVNLTPTVGGYCANLARPFYLGEPPPEIRELADTYLEMRETTRTLLRPGAKVSELDDAGREVCEQHGLGELHIRGISHGLGLRFEETPASTIIPAHRSVKLRAGMTMTIGHTILARPGVAGLRFEDVYRVTEEGGEVLQDYPTDWILG